MQLEPTRSHQQTGLVKLSESVILREQDKNEVLIHIAGLLQRLGKLFQVPNWSEENAVILAEWVYDNYKFDSLKAVTECLKNPPIEGKNWRLTPDTIQEWMSKTLEKVSIQLEKENTRYKEQMKEPLPNVDYESFKKRLEKGEALQDQKIPNGFTDDGYLKYKAERARLQALKNKPENI